MIAADASPAPSPSSVTHGDFGYRLGPITVLVDRHMSARSWPKVAAAIEHKGAARVGAIAICVLVAGILWIGNAIAMIVLPLMLWSILEAAMDFFDASVLLRSWVFGLWFCFCGLPPVIGVLSVVRHARVRMVPLYQLMGTACITLGLAILSLAMQMR